MTKLHTRSDRRVVKDNVVPNARRASRNLKSNATSFKKGRKKTGGRTAGTPNKTTRTFREMMLAAAANAGNEMGLDGEVGYLTEVAIKCPSSFLHELARAMPRQLEPEQTSPSEDDDTVLHTVEEVYEELRQYGVPPDSFARAILHHCTKAPPEQEHSGLTSSTDDRRVEDDASDDSTRGGEV